MVSEMMCTQLNCRYALYIHFDACCTHCEKYSSTALHLTVITPQHLLSDLICKIITGSII